MNRKEKKFLIIFIILCASLPFVMIGDPLEIASLVAPLWIYSPGAAGLWLYCGKPFWQVVLVCYAVGSVAITSLYLGTNLAQLLFRRIGQRIKIKKTHKTFPPKTHLDNKKKKTIRWLNKQSLWLILLIFFIPFPWSDSIATIVMRIKGIKNGLWYLLALNMPHTLLVVFVITKLLP